MAKWFLPNPGFELGDQDWNKGSNWTIEKDVPNARSGSWLAKFVNAGEASSSVNMQASSLSVRPGGKFTVQGWFNTFSGTAGDARVSLEYFDLASVTISSSPGNVIMFGQSGYIQSSLVDHVAPDRAKTIKIRFQVNGAVGTYLFDDFIATGDIIEDIPTTANIASHRIVPADTIGVFDPLIGADKFTEFNAGMSDKWSGVYTFIPSLGADLGELVSFIRRLGRTERFFAFDPDRTVPLNGIVNGMTVDGPITNGTNKIPVKAGPVSSTALVAGDYMEVKDQYFQLQRDLEIGPEGTGEAIVWPAVRSTLADGEDVITDNPKMVARITSDLDWRRVEARPVDLTISWAEV